MKKYDVKYKINNSSGHYSTVITANSANQAREQIKARHLGKNVTFLAVVEL